MRPSIVLIHTFAVQVVPGSNHIWIIRFDTQNS